MPVLILAVQNSVRPADLGTATSANNYFRQIGGSVGVAVFGTLFADRLADAPRRAPPRARACLPDPELAHPAARPRPARPRCATPTSRRTRDAMPRIFLYLVPVLVLGLLIAFFLKEKPLVSHDEVPAESGPPQPRSPRPGPPPAADPAARVRRTSAGVPVCGTVQHPDGTVVPRAALTLIDVTGRQIGRGAQRRGRAVRAVHARARGRTC